MYCRNCSKQINDKAEICIYCGTTPFSSNNYCNFCGSKTNINQVLCLSCKKILNPSNSNYSNSIIPVLSHILAFFTGVIGPLILYLISNEYSNFEKHNIKEALNFQLTILLSNFIFGLLTIIFIGYFFLIALWILDIIFTIIAISKTCKNEFYLYPLSIRFIK